MVERVESTGLQDFTATVTSVQLEEGIEDRKQYHIEMKPHDIEVQGATGKFHEWIAMSPKCTEEKVPQGSVMDRYLTQIEICISEAKKAKTINDAFNLMVDKKFKFKRIKLGKDFDGHKAKEYLVPVALVE